MRVTAIYTLYCGGNVSNLAYDAGIITRDIPQAISDIDTELLFKCFPYLQTMSEFLCRLILMTSTFEVKR